MSKDCALPSQGSLLNASRQIMLFIYTWLGGYRSATLIGHRDVVQHSRENSSVSRITCFLLLYLFPVDPMAGSKAPRTHCGVGIWLVGFIYLLGAKLSVQTVVEVLYFAVVVYSYTFIVHRQSSL